MKLRKVLSVYKHRYFPSAPKTHTAKLLGKDFIVLQGTIRAEDKDDAWYFALVKNHDRIFDLGANIGYTSILASFFYSDKIVVLADPNPDALAMASGNLIRNGLSINKQFVPAFVSDKCGEKVKFYTVGIGEAGSMFASAAESARLTNSFYLVDTLTVDEIVKRTSVTPDFIKVDVEGAEHLVLNGATALAKERITTFFVEMHAVPELTMEQNATHILNWCTNNNYKAYYLKEHEHITEAKTIAHRGKCHLLLIPSESEYPEYLKGIPEGGKLAL